MMQQGMALHGGGDQVGTMLGGTINIFKEL